MSKLEYDDKQFDVAYCISTFEHIPYKTFMKSVQEAYRVLKDNGLLIITLDERWDNNIPYTQHNNWNILELNLIELGLYANKLLPFSLPSFLNLIQDYFVPLKNDTIVDNSRNFIYSKNKKVVYYSRKNRDPDILSSGDLYNSSVSYAILKKKS